MAELPGAAFSDWIGRSVETTDLAAAAPLRRLAATLGVDWAGDVVPPLGHWLFHLPEAPHADLGPDGHPHKGGFLPPIAQPRRMWAGGRVRFLCPVRVGAALLKRSTIVDIVAKPGATGEMVFVTLRHVIVADGEDAIVEEQDLVYLPVSAPAEPRPVATPPPEIEQTMVADEILLFRFSALTFNAHRIHYDAPYARDVELYPGLVVHGPLQAMLLIGLAQAGGAAPTHFAFRGRAPLYAGQPFMIARAGEALWIRDARGTVTMTASTAA